MSDQEQFLEPWKTLDETEGESLLRLPEGELFETALQKREAADVIQVVECQVKPSRPLEMPEKAEVLARFAVYIELDIGPVGDEVAGPLQLRRRERLIELDDAAFRL